VSSDPAWTALHLLAEPTRRKVFQACRTAPGPLTREAVADATGISRRLAAFHLDQLADAGLLTVDYARPEGRTGPGAGRPAKRYAAAPVDLELSVPPRRYELAARIMARGLAASGTGGDAQEQTLSAARDEGEQLGRLRRPAKRMSAVATIEATTAALDDLGYEPSAEPSGCVRLMNCPFHAVVGVATDVVCGINLEFVTGVIDGLGGHRSVRASLEPGPDHCCVAVCQG
jgi:predicted ArsR family transcriptional regulator